MKIPFFLPLPVLRAAEDSSTGSLLTQNSSQSPVTDGASKYYLWLLLASAAMVYPVVWAEEGKNWPLAQACLVTILVLLALTLWFWWQSKNRVPEPSVGATVYSQALEKLLWCVAIGIFAMISNATRTEYWVHGIVARAIGYGILIAGAAFISGVLLGYLFGLRPTENSRQSGQEPGPPPSTNLAEIADWLTKVILGAGLVQLTRLPGPIWTFAGKMAEGVVLDTGENPNPAVALAIMGFFSTCGLLYGYFWTRYEDALTFDAGADAWALALVDRWLNAHPAPDEQTRSAMIKAMNSASPAAKMRIFLQAEQYRKLFTEDVNERALPVFEALVAADPEGIFHRSRGQQALALIGRKKDPKRPDDDWRLAFEVLNDAIRIRDSSREPGWHDYEFARAVCQIRLDPNFKKQQPSDLQTVQSIRADLDQAADVPEATKKLIDQGRAVDTWEGFIAKKAA